MTGKAIAKKIILYAVLLIVISLLQGSVFTYVKLFGAKPLFLPLAAVAFGLFEGSLWGGLLGLAAGIFCDFIVGDTLVLFTVLLPLLGFACGLLSEYILARGFPSFCVCALISIFLCGFLQAFKYYAFTDIPFWPITAVILLQAAASAVFIIPVYWAVRFISRRSKA
ncbi:MAG: hypothetical protein II784_01755 [Oscillospiraceae bacterium]|nr:hypothetical protein [Oscillospiraceae bacterium]